MGMCEEVGRGGGRSRELKRQEEIGRQQFY